jgi:hypothetical protein
MELVAEYVKLHEPLKQTEEPFDAKWSKGVFRSEYLTMEADCHIQSTEVMREGVPIYATGRTVPVSFSVVSRRNRVRLDIRLHRTEQIDSFHQGIDHIEFNLTVDGSIFEGCYIVDYGIHINEDYVTIDALIECQQMTMIAKE